MERSIRFCLLLDPYERLALTRLAEIAGGMSQGAMVRNLIRREARERGLWPPAGPAGLAQRREPQQEKPDDPA